MSQQPAKPHSPVEVELKFHLPAGARAVLEKQPPLADAPAETHHLVTTYFDTADRALDRCGLTLRVRIRGEVRVQTVKSRPDGQGVAAARGEWEWLIDQETPDLAWLASTKPLADIAATLEGRLHPSFAPMSIAPRALCLWPMA